MEKLKLKLDYCFGIKKLDEEIDYSSDNVAIIYASNGTMKSSLADTFRCIRDNKPVQERVYHKESIYDITDENDKPIEGDNIIVVNPTDRKLYEGQGLLMANDDLREKYWKIHSEIEQKKEDLYARVKIALGYTNRSHFDVKETLLTDWDCPIYKEYDCLKAIEKQLQNSEMHCAINSEDVNYELLFGEKVSKMMETGETPNLIEEYEKKYQELMNKSLYMQNGVIDHNNYSNINKTLVDNGFFDASNEIVLNAKDGSESIHLKKQNELEELIDKEKEQVLNTVEMKSLFEKINKEITKNKDTTALSAFLHNHQEIIAEFKDISLFKKKIWVKVFAEYEKDLGELIKSYDKAREDLENIRDEAKKEKTDWQEALSVFKERFYVPFVIKTSNQDDVILNSEMPSFIYYYEDDQEKEKVTKEGLLDVLSTGEKRAFYILNIIFQILVAQKEEKEYLVIFDDISESFDYKNKYAILEYIKDISEYKNKEGKKLFNVLLMTHNFDFYRTVASRITKRSNAYIGYMDSGKIKLEKGHYTNNIFIYYKTQLKNNYSDKIMLASIPFVRNIIEFTEGIENEDYLTLTSLLHYKKDTHIITLKKIQDIFNKYWLKDATFAENREDEYVYDILMYEGEQITNVERVEIENKLILSMATRLKAELYMKNRIVSDLPEGISVIEKIYSEKNQTGKLFDEYKKNINDEAVKVLETVVMITPANIHLNSFMFEPILDMSINQLFDQYNKVKNLASDFD